MKLKPGQKTQKEIVKLIMAGKTYKYTKNKFKFITSLALVTIYLFVKNKRDKKGLETVNWLKEAV